VSLRANIYTPGVFSVDTPGFFCFCRGAVSAPDSTTRHSERSVSVVEESLELA